MVVVCFDDVVLVFYGWCLYCGVFMLDGYVDDSDNLICGVYYWDYWIDMGVLEYNNFEVLYKFRSWVDGDDVLVDVEEVVVWVKDNL